MRSGKERRRNGAESIGTKLTNAASPPKTIRGGTVQRIRRFTRIDYSKIT